MTPSDLAQYKELGYLVVRNILPEYDMCQLKRQAREIVLGNRPIGFDKTVVKDINFIRKKCHPDDPEDAMWKLIRPDLYDPVFVEFSKNKLFQNIGQELVGHPVQSILTMFIYKPPGIKSIHPDHQDAFYLPKDCSPDQAIGVWIPLDPVNEENGTLEIIPQSHKLGLQQHVELQGEFINKGLFEAKGFSEDRTRIFLELEAGDAVFFHPLLVHSTSSNKSSNHRRVATIHFYNRQRRLAIDSNCLYKVKE